MRREIATSCPRSGLGARSDRHRSAVRASRRWLRNSSCASLNQLPSPLNWQSRTGTSDAPRTRPCNVPTTTSRTADNQDLNLDTLLTPAKRVRGPRSGSYPRRRPGLIPTRPRAGPKRATTTDSRLTQPRSFRDLTPAKRVRGPRSGSYPRRRPGLIPTRPRAGPKRATTTDSRLTQPRSFRDLTPAKRA
jgi:hypothetical protein